VFKKEATKSLEVFIPKSKKRGKCSANHRWKFYFTKSYIPFINNSSTTNYVNKNGRGKTFLPHTKAPVQKWVYSTHKNVQYGKNNVVKGNTSNTITRNVTTDTNIQTSHANMPIIMITKEKNPMT